MTAAVNIQALPVPEIWLAAGAPEPYKIADEDGIPILDEDGKEITEG
jgi:hypothetical protein